MNMSNTNHLNILDFPNELLLIIIKQLNMVDVLYSLADVNVCLYLLDGRLNSLSKLFLHITDIQSTSETIDNTVGFLIFREKNPNEIYYLVSVFIDKTS